MAGAYRATVLQDREGAALEPWRKEMQEKKQATGGHFGSEAAALPFISCQCHANFQGSPKPCSPNLRERIL